MWQVEENSSVNFVYWNEKMLFFFNINMQHRSLVAGVINKMERAKLIRERSECN